MEWLTVEYTAFYAAVWAIGFFSAVSEIGASGSSGESFAQRCYLGSISGILAFASVAIFCGRGDDHITNHWFYLGLASLVGMSVRQRQAIKERLIEVALGVAEQVSKFGKNKNNDNGDGGNK